MRFVDINEDDPTQRETGPQEPTWQTVAEVTGLANPLFDATLFAVGYDFSSNVYVLQGEYLSIIDPGNDYLIYMDLFRQGVRLDQIKKVALTHGHPDHCMGVVELFRGYPGLSRGLEVEVVLHEAGPAEYKEILRAGGLKLTEIKGGETINLSGFDFQVIHTPGHTLDGVCYFHAPTQTLFSGDTVLPDAMSEMDQAAGGRMDHYLYGLRQLMKLDIQHVMPGHGGIAPLVGRRVVLDTFESLIRKVVGDDTPWMAAATALANQGLLEEALFCCHKKLAQVPDDLKALETKAYLLNDMGRQAEAVAAFDEVLQRQPEHFYARFGKATALMAMDKYSEALTLYDELLALQPGNKEIQVNKGLALFLSGRQEEALEIPAFQEAFAEKIKEELQKQKQ